ncbi:MAG: polynucleotide adenylyltransferase PcnB [Candidatus Binataceae bacterium]|nr:polynucleotide adenylyltransferase PcnB [Candidatus Binataceae bacterium]
MTPRILDRSEHPISRRDIDPNVLKVLYRLVSAGHIAYLVGGGVRDLMLGRRPKDFDVATSAHPSEVRELFRNSRLIGRRFRLVHVFFGPHNIEVATFRRRSEDVVEDGDLMIRHDNTFGTPEEDAFRRDFTVNALFYDIRTFQVIDYVGGVEDLRHRLVRTIGDPEIRLREDPVRMIRAIRQCARFDFQMEAATESAMTPCREDLRKAAMARLVEETYRTLGMSGAARALESMLKFGLLDTLLPHLAEHLSVELAQSGQLRTAHNLASLERAIGTGAAADRALVLAALYLDLFLKSPLFRATGGMQDLLTDLRLRGYARGDTERMRLILESFPRLLHPTRSTLRMARRPYFAEALAFYELMAPNYGAASAELDRLLTTMTAHPVSPARKRRRRRRRRQPSMMVVSGAPSLSSAAAIDTASDTAIALSASPARLGVKDPD